MTEIRGRDKIPTMPFPHARLHQDLTKAGLSTGKAARRVGLDPGTISDIRRGRRQPSWRTVVRLVALVPDPAPYLRFSRAPRITLGCPFCPRIRVVTPGRLRLAMRRIPGRRLRRLGPDRYALPCQSCSARLVGRAALGRINRRLTKRMGAAMGRVRIAPRELWENIWGGREKSERRRQRFADMARGPRTKAWREAIGRARVAEARIRGPLFLCPLCKLALLGHPWHRYCRDALNRAQQLLNRAWSGGHTLCRSAGRGRRPDTEILLAAYKWFMARVVGGATRSEALASGHYRLSATGTTKAIGRLIARFPGQWQHFCTSREGHKDRGNRIRQAVFPLPGSLGMDPNAPIGKGERDHLVLRLYAASMRPKQIADLTGVPLDRVHLIVKNFSAMPREQIADLAGVPVDLVNCVMGPSGREAQVEPGRLRVADVLRDYEADLKRRGVKEYRRLSGQIGRLERGLGRMCVDALTREELLARWARTELDGGTAEKTVRFLVGVLNAAVNCARRAGRLTGLLIEPFSPAVVLRAAQALPATQQPSLLHPRRIPEKRARAAPRRQHAERFLVEFLAGAVRPASDIRAEAQARGITQDTLREAKARIRMRVFRIAIPGQRGGGRWFWAASGLRRSHARRMAREYKSAA